MPSPAPKAGNHLAVWVLWKSDALSTYAFTQCLTVLRDWHSQWVFPETATSMTIRAKQEACSEPSLSACVILPFFVQCGKVPASTRRLDSWMPEGRVINGCCPGKGKLGGSPERRSSSDPHRPARGVQAHLRRYGVSPTKIIIRRR